MAIGGTACGLIRKYEGWVAQQCLPEGNPFPLAAADTSHQGTPDPSVLCLHQAQLLRKTRDALDNNPMTPCHPIAPSS